MIDQKEMKKLKTHSKKHKGGMNSTHIKNMKKIMNTNNTPFIVAHKKAVQLDNNNNAKSIKSKKSKSKKPKSNY